MSTCGEVLATIFEIVPNYEKETLIRNKMNQMIRFISSSGWFWRDITEVTIAEVDGVDATAVIQSIPITTGIRRLIYCKYPDSIPNYVIDCVNLDSLLHSCDKMGDLAYLSGSNLHIKNSQLTSEFAIGYYTNPVFFAVNGDDDDEDNWITDLTPGLVEDLTAAYVLNLIGEKEDSGRLTSLATMMQATYIQDFILSISD